MRSNYPALYRVPVVPVTYAHAVKRVDGIWNLALRHRCADNMSIVSNKMYMKKV